MARKQTAKAPAAAKPLDRLQASMKNLQRDAEQLLKKTGARASSVITRDQKKAMDRVIGQITRLREDLEARARRVGRELEGRTEKFLKSLERETGRRFLVFVRRLDIPSRHEIQALTRRMDQLEKKIRSRPAPARRAKPAGAPPSRSV